MWPSCPQACIRPSWRELYGNAGSLEHVQRVEIGAQADRIVVVAVRAARRPRRSWRVRYAPRGRKRAACRRRRRWSPFPRRRFPDARGYDGARTSCPAASAATSGTMFMMSDVGRRGVDRNAAPSARARRTAVECAHLASRRMTDTAANDVRPRHRRRRHQRRGHRARRRGTRPERRAVGEGRPRLAHLVVEHQAHPRRIALSRILRVPAGRRIAGRARSAARGGAAHHRAAAIRAAARAASAARVDDPRGTLSLRSPWRPAQPAGDRSASKLRPSAWGAGLKSRFRTGFVYSDARVDDARLVVVNAIDARAHGADIRVRTEMIDAQRDARRLEHRRSPCIG